MTQRVLVCGGRGYGVVPANATERDMVRADFERTVLFNFLDRALRQGRVGVIIHGGATGADSLAGEWAAKRGVPVEVHPADWSLGRHAGPIRNARMIDEGKPDVVVACPGNAGTADCLKRARAAGVRVVEV